MTSNNHPMNEHRFDAAVEDVRWVMDHDGSFEEACRRVGMSTSAVEKMFTHRGLPDPSVKKERV